jgi:hypothetical protein
VNLSRATPSGRSQFRFARHHNLLKVREVTNGLLVRVNTDGRIATRFVLKNLQSLFGTKTHPPVIRIAVISGRKTLTLTGGLWHQK